MFSLFFFFCRGPRADSHKAHVANMMNGREVLSGNEPRLRNRYISRLGPGHAMRMQGGSSNVGRQKRELKDGSSLACIAYIILHGRYMIHTGVLLFVWGMCPGSAALLDCDVKYAQWCYICDMENANPLRSMIWLSLPLLSPERTWYEKCFRSRRQEGEGESCSELTKSIPKEV